MANSYSNAVIDMRSDTVTKPTDAMREAMMNAAVGDDVFGDDPTVNQLEALAAEMLGKEAGLFVPSGTMGNLLCCMTHCNQRGSEMILGNESHMFFYEQGGSATLAGVHPRAIPTQPDGTLRLQDIESAIRSNDVHFPITRLVCLENTHNRCGGRVLTAEYIDSVGELTKKHNLKLHLDGARVFNAAVYLGISVSRLVRACDTVSVCLSKGLAAPVGSVVVGPRAFILEARRYRKALGGGMRQAGVLAACGLLSLTKMVDRLKDDHANAHELAAGLARLGFGVDPATVQTNLVFFDLDPVKHGEAAVLRDYLREKGVLTTATAAHRMRFVTHYQVSRDDVSRTLSLIGDFLSRKN